jgi:hypothetical protein
MKRFHEQPLARDQVLPGFGHPAACPAPGGLAEHPRELALGEWLTVADAAAVGSYRGVSTQNSRPSGSAITTWLTSPWPMSMRVAPRETRRSTSSS